MKKMKVTSDFLYKYLTEHDITISKIASVMGVSDSVVYRSFRHAIDRLGRPVWFSPKNIYRLNNALEQIADELRGKTIHFGSEQTFTNQHGRTYDPGAVPAIQAIGEYFNLKGMTERVLGWNKTKRDTTLSIQKSPVYGNITADDVNRINAELLSVAGVLSSYEVVAEDGSSSSDEASQTADRQSNNKCTRTRKTDAFTAAPQPWDDTKKSAIDRYHLYKEQHSDGVLFFRVLTGYTVAQDDAQLIASIDNTMKPWTDITTGVTTLYMESDVFDKVLPRLVAQNHHIAVTNME